MKVGFGGVPWRAVGCPWGGIVCGGVCCGVKYRRSVSVELYFMLLVLLSFAYIYIYAVMVVVVVVVTCTRW